MELELMNFVEKLHPTGSHTSPPTMADWAIVRAHISVSRGSPLNHMFRPRGSKSAMLAPTRCVRLYLFRSSPAASVVAGKKRIVRNARAETLRESFFRSNLQLISASADRPIFGGNYSTVPIDSRYSLIESDDPNSVELSIWTRALFCSELAIEARSGLPLSTTNAELCPKRLRRSKVTAVCSRKGSPQEHTENPALKLVIDSMDGRIRAEYHGSLMELDRLRGLSCHLGTGSPHRCPAVRRPGRRPGSTPRSSRWAEAW